jgi:hypothetical protein
VASSLLEFVVGNLLRSHGGGHFVGINSITYPIDALKAFTRGVTESPGFTLLASSAGFGLACRKNHQSPFFPLAQFL